MKSSSGFYRPGLDQLRGLAIYLVFCWHFVHSDNIVTLTGEQAAWWPLNVVNQGFAGVSLFMVLSGYLFAGLTEGRDIRWGAFLRNRALRLLPLLVVVMLAALVKFSAQGKLDEWVKRLSWGWLMPSLPQGAWSITVEAHYYLLLPLLLWLGRRHPARFRDDAWWIWLPTVDGLFFAMTVAWYDTSFEGRKISLPGRLAILAGQSSYSMYLLHTFWVFSAARWIHAHVWAMNSAQSAIAVASLLFVLALPTAMLSYRFIELPFLRARKPYEAQAPAQTPAEAAAAQQLEARRAS
jgi:peptidoglycan/LPS O-acetylase OafA/YrhL